MSGSIEKKYDDLPLYEFFEVEEIGKDSFYNQKIKQLFNIILGRNFGYDLAFLLDAKISKNCGLYDSWENYLCYELKNKGWSLKEIFIKLKPRVLTFSSIKKFLKNLKSKEFRNNLDNLKSDDYWIKSKANEYFDDLNIDYDNKKFYIIICKYFDFSGFLEEEKNLLDL